MHHRALFQRPDAVGQHRDKPIDHMRYPRVTPAQTEFAYMPCHTRLT